MPLAMNGASPRVIRYVETGSTDGCAVTLLVQHGNENYVCMSCKDGGANTQPGWVESIPVIGSLEGKYTADTPSLAALLSCELRLWLRRG
jgi:hypothetical protein